jgi:hypothetical protein
MAVNEIKTDMFPEVLRMKAKDKQEHAGKKEWEGVHNNIAVPAEKVGEPFKQGKEKKAAE